MFDAKAAWGMAHDSVMTGSQSVNLDNDRMLTEARVTGNWGWNGWQLSQSGAITYLDDGGSGDEMAPPGASPEVTRFSLGPELKHRIETGNGGSVEPFAFFKSSVDLAGPGGAVPFAQNTVGGGVLLAKPDTYSIRATADFTDGAGSADEVATGKVSVSVPSSLLGF